MMSANATSAAINVYVEPTPNPNSLKFIVGREIARGSYEFASKAEAGSSPLAVKLFQIPGVEGVFVGMNFVSVRKTSEASWDAIEPAASKIIERMVNAGERLVAAEAQPEAAGSGSDVESRIRKILADEVRPAVAMDGGDVVFRHYRNGVLTLALQGACSGCPSSLMTLKGGIERRLKEDIPELVEVIAEM